MDQGLKHRLPLMIWVFLLFIPVMAQQPARSDPYRPSAPDPSSSLMFSFDYASNTNLMGNFNAVTRQPSLSPALSFFSKWGPDISVLGYFVDNSDDSLEHFTSELDLMLGYSIKPVEKLTLYPSYSHYFYSKNSNSLKSMFSDEIRMDIDYTEKFFSLGASTGYFLGEQHAFYLTLRNYYTVDFDQFLFREGWLSIQPGIDANFGSYEYLNLYYLEKLSEDPWFYTYLLSYPVIRRYVWYEKMQNPGMTTREILDNYLMDIAQDNFKLTSLSINLPAYFMLGKFGINLGLTIIIPFGQPDYMSDDVQLFVDVGLSYSLMFRK